MKKQNHNNYLFCVAAVFLCFFIINTGLTAQTVEEGSVRIVEEEKDVSPETSPEVPADAELPGPQDSSVSSEDTANKPVVAEKAASVSGSGIEVLLFPGLVMYKDCVGFEGGAGVVADAGSFISGNNFLKNIIAGAGCLYHGAVKETVAINSVAGYLSAGYRVDLPWNLRLIPAFRFGCAGQKVTDGRETVQSGLTLYGAPCLLLDYPLPWYDRLRAGIEASYNYFGGDDRNVTSATAALFLSLAL